MTLKSVLYFYIILPDKGRYFKQISIAERETESRKRVGEDSKGIETTFLIFPKSSAAGGKQDTYIESALNAYVVYRKVSAWKEVNASHCLQASKGAEENEDIWVSLKRGVCVQTTSVREDEVSQETSNKIAALIKSDSKLQALKLTFHTNKSYKLTHIEGSVNLAVEDREIWLTPVSYTEVATNCQTMMASPIFTVPCLRPVFHSYKDAYQVLSKMIHQPEVKELLDITDKLVSKENLLSNDQPLPQPFVVVEGMDATGKTTLTEVLEKKLGAARYFTPPHSVAHLRPFFDNLPEIVRRAYYCMGNYIVADSIREECQKRPVIMDRFWHSTTAYGIANETSEDDLPEVGHPVYQWPSDLLKPTLVLFLTVSEEIRKQRLVGRGVQATFEEKKLDKDQLFRQRLCTSYRRMQNPACIEIDASGTVEEVQAAAIKVLAQHNVNL